MVQLVSKVLKETQDIMVQLAPPVPKVLTAQPVLKEIPAPLESKVLLVTMGQLDTQVLKDQLVPMVTLVLMVLLVIKAQLEKTAHLELQDTMVPLDQLEPKVLLDLKVSLVKKVKKVTMEKLV